MVFCEECCNIYKKQGCYLSSPKEHSWLFVCPELCTSSDWNIFCRTFIGMYASLTAQSQLACDGFAISLRLISRHFRPGPHGTPLRLPGQFWESGGYQVTFNLDLKPGEAFLIAIWSPINHLMPGRWRVPGQILDNPDNPYISPAVKSARHRWPLDRHTTDSRPATVQDVRISRHPAGY